MARGWCASLTAWPILSCSNRASTIETLFSMPSNPLELDGEDLLAASIDERKARLVKLLAGSKSGIVYSEHVELNGPAVFAAAMPDGAGRDRLQTSGQAVPAGLLQALDRSQESKRAGNDTAGERCLIHLIIGVSALFALYPANKGIAISLLS